MLGCVGCIGLSRWSSATTAILLVKFGVHNWLVVEKVHEEDLVENYEIAARSARSQENEICKDVSEQRIDYATATTGCVQSG